MGTVRSLWALVQGDPTFMRRLNGWLTIVWVVMIPVSFAFGWLKSIAFVSALQIEKEKAEPVEERVVEAIVQETELVSTDAAAPAS